MIPKTLLKKKGSTVLIIPIIVYGKNGEKQITSKYHVAVANEKGKVGAKVYVTQTDELVKNSKEDHL